MKTWAGLLGVTVASWLALTMVHCAVPEAKPLAIEDLVTIQVKGTRIDVLPGYVDVIVADPGRAVDQAVKAGAERDDGVSNGLMFRRVQHIFITPKEMNAALAGRKYAAGEVIYGFLVESGEARGRFVKKYALKEEAQVVSREDLKQTLYVASPGYYVMVLAKQRRYLCAMHPKITMPQEGKCSECGLDLILMEVWE